MATKTLSMTKISKKYRPLILEFMDDIKREFEEEGYYMDDPYEMSDEEYQWSLFGGPADYDVDNPDDNCFNIDVTILESKYHDGEDDFGINFSLTISRYGGKVISVFAPYNYTDEIWVSRKDPDAVKERWDLFESGCDPCVIVSMLQSNES